MRVFILSLFLIGCASDPYGTVNDFDERGGVRCRVLSGNIGTMAVDGHGTGFSCLDLGPIDGCLQFDNGQFDYESSGCKE